MKITNVESIGTCRALHYTYQGKTKQCNTPLVRITFANNNVTVCHDDGSFIAYTGEQDG